MMREPKNVTATEFRNQAGRYLEEAAKAPVVITRHSRPSRVLLDIEEYERLKTFEDTRRSVYPHELGDEFFEEGYQAKPTPELDHLLED